jgi:hypothetical protein
MRGHYVLKYTQSNVKINPLKTRYFEKISKTDTGITYRDESAHIACLHVSVVAQVRLIVQCVLCIDLT